MKDVPILNKEQILEIDEFCTPLSHFGLSHFVMAIHFNDNSIFTLSNTGSITEDAHHQSLHKVDFPIKAGCTQQGDENSISPFHIVRTHSECTFVFTAQGSSTTYEFNQVDYEQATREFETFCINFVERFLDLIICFNPSYRFSFILTNQLLREAVIRQGFAREIKISTRQHECLWLAVQGKKVKEIARELNISPYTVEDYLKNIKKLFNTNSLSEIMFECIHRGIFGKIGLNSIEKSPSFYKENTFSKSIVNSR